MKTPVITYREHQELGDVVWRRNFDASSIEAKSIGKPILLLFQEIPGCSTCVRFGRDALAHPLMVEMIQDHFVPVAIYNNRKGPDAEIVRRFGEPAWNNPVVHFLNPDGTALLPKLSDRYDAIALHDKIAGAVERMGWEVPEYFRLLRGDLLIDSGLANKAWYETPCFWSGEVSLLEHPAVLSTDAGWIEGEEVVEVHFDPRIASLADLDHFARNEGFVRAQSGRFGIDTDPQYYLAKTNFSFLPLTKVQRSKINHAIPYRLDPEAFISPTQLGWLHASASQPRRDLTNYRQDIRDAWHRMWPDSKAA